MTLKQAAVPEQGAQVWRPVFETKKTAEKIISSAVQIIKAMEANKTNTTIYKILRTAMILFWVYVGIEKFWQLGAFHIALQQQPVISALAPLLFWLLPLLEISIGALLGLPARRLQHWGWIASTIMITLFSIYIALGVLDVYDKKPCICTSFLSNISWTAHLIFNLVILGLSLAGLVLNRNVLLHEQSNLTNKTAVGLFLTVILAIEILSYKNTAFKPTHEIWFMPDSMDHAPVYDSVSRPIVGSLAYRYDRYTEPYRHYLFTNSMQANSMTNQLLACNTERRVALC
ncbi:MauE/DoxX family redox-associated membrane protein [Sphingobacterium sp. UBA7631]|uniref:MauE/DoxX family redox-associated membrane protein n=2 Tax=Sphingobacteriaceae TaxID=84566 RepID=UPI002579C50A|nr:MauE/DoxX family redox-associated membrane protein [Sphingobacterium sp. UBA7631]